MACPLSDKQNKGALTAVRTLNLPGLLGISNVGIIGQPFSYFNCGDDSQTTGVLLDQPVRSDCCCG